MPIPLAIIPSLVRGIIKWRARRRARKEALMKPFPKWIGAVGAIGALVTSVKVALSTGDWTAVGAAIGAVLALFSHSATGTGGKG